jgi:hypothetical protein
MRLITFMNIYEHIWTLNGYKNNFIIINKHN